jgi:hypothetical protein
VERVSEVAGIHLTRTDENVDEIDALAALTGGRAGLTTLLGDLDRRARRSLLGRLLGRAVHRAYSWDAVDRRDQRWWPQGISTSADASDTEDVEGRRLLVVSWYAKDDQGVRVTFLDLGTRRYRHVLLVVPTLEDGVLGLEPLKVHAGGIVWHGPYLHVAATARGVVTCRLDDILRLPDHDTAAELTHDRFGVDDGRLATYGYRYVLPVRFTYRAVTSEGLERLRYSFLSLDRRSDPPQLVAGEYGNSRQTRRLARFPLDPATLFLATGDDGVSRPLVVDDEGAVRTQGAAIVDGTWYLTASTGPRVPGSVYVGQPGTWRRFRWATPMGPEDVAWWPSTDLLWSVTEHPRRRWVYCMRRGFFDR